MSTNQRSIYVYSTPTYLKNGWLKVGQTDRDPEKRVREQDSTACPEELKILWSTTAPNTLKDEDIHNELERLGYHRVRGDKREWFECDVDAVKRAFNSLLKGSARPNSYSLRPEQQECHDKCLKAFESGLCASERRSLFIRL